MHATDDRRRAGIDRLEHLVEAHRIPDVLVVREVDRRALPLHVRSGAETRAITRQHDSPGVADIGEGLRELDDESGIERVAPIGAREGHVENGSVAFHPKSAHPEELRVPQC